MDKTIGMPASKQKLTSFWHTLKCLTSLHLLRLFNLIQYQVCNYFSTAFFQSQKYFPTLFKATFHFYNVLAAGTTACTMNAGCRNSHDIDIVDFAQINIVANVGSSETTKRKGPTTHRQNFFDLEVVGRQFVRARIRRTKSSTCRKSLIAFREIESFFSFPQRFDAFHETSPTRQFFEMMLGHEAIADYINPNFFQIVICQRRSKPSSDSMALQSGSIRPETSTGKERSKFVLIPILKV
mmetsp:Transcript_2511/g.3350  ORF Transcript_2511/g.3350 Transcript_2511/m.3350 type:complete len:239 (+) Transcript_2511:204-920(+)